MRSIHSVGWVLDGKGQTHGRSRLRSMEGEEGECESGGLEGSTLTLIVCGRSKFKVAAAGSG